MVGRTYPLMKSLRTGKFQEILTESLYITCMYNRLCMLDIEIIDLIISFIYEYLA